MHYQHEFVVKNSPAAVRDFHLRSANMAAITPPPIIVRVHSAPENIREGDGMAFTLWFGPFPIRWQARFEQFSERGFVDRQEHGPFREWIHRHSFIPLENGDTLVRDEIQADFLPNPLWVLVGLAMWLPMPVLFAYRGWRTRHLLAKKQP